VNFRELEEGEQWLPNCVRNANKPIPAVSAITTKKANAPKRLVSMRLLNLVTNHQKTGKIEKRALAFITLMAFPSLALGQIRSTAMLEEVLSVEREFSQAIVRNDAEAVGQLLADEWIIAEPDGGIIDKPQFLSVTKSGTLTHEMMESSQPET
jgi:hypothetical protein